MSTLFFDGFDRAYNDPILDPKYWSQEHAGSDTEASSPMYCFEGNVIQSGNRGSKDYPDRRINDHNYYPSTYPNRLITYHISPFAAELPSGQRHGAYNDYPGVGNAPGYVTLVNVNARNEFDLSPIDYIALTGFDNVAENATSAYVGCRFLGIETKSLDFVSNPDRFGDKHPLMAFVSGNQTGMLLSIVRVSGNWFRNQKIDDDLSPITMGLQVEQNGGISGIFDLNVSSLVDEFQIRSVADFHGPKTMDVNTGKVLTIQKDTIPPVQRDDNTASTLSRWAMINVEIQYDPTPLVSVQIEGIDCVSIPLDDPSVDVSDRSDPNLNFEIEVEPVPFNRVEIFNRSYDSDIKDPFIDPDGADDTDINRNFYTSYYYMGGRQMAIDDLHINDNALPEPTGRLGLEARTVRLFPGFPEHYNTGLGNDAFFPDGLSEWSGLDEVHEYIIDNTLIFCCVAPLSLTGTYQKRNCVKDKDCFKEGLPWDTGTCGGGAKYIYSYNSGDIQTFPYFAYTDELFASQFMYLNLPSYTTQGCDWTPQGGRENDLSPLPPRPLLFSPDDSSVWRNYLASGMGGIKIYNEYKNTFLHSAFENVFFSPDSEDWPPVDLDKTDAHLIFDDSLFNTTNILNSGIATTGTETFFPDDRMCLITGTDMMFPADPDKWSVGRGINFNGGHVLPYMTNLSRYQYNMQRFGVCEQCPTCGNSNGCRGIDRWSGSGVNSGQAWTISTWVYFENEDDIIHLYSRFFDDEVNISGGIDYIRGMDRNKYLFNLGDDPPGDPIFPDAYYLSCENPPDPNGVSPDPAYWDCNDYYTATGGIPLLNRENNYGEWQFALYATRSGIRLSTIGAATNLYYYRFQQNPATFNEQNINAPAGFHNPDNVPYTQQFEGSMQNPIGDREWFFSGEIPVKQWCHIEINKSSDRTVRVFSSGYPASGHQVVAGSHVTNWYRGLMQDMCGETLTGPTTDLYKFNASGFHSNYWYEPGGPGNDLFPFPWMDVGPIFNSIYPIQGNTAMIGYPNPMIEVPARVGGGYSQIADYVYVTGEATHLSQYPLPSVQVPLPKDFYMSTANPLTGINNLHCGYDNYYLFQDPVSNDQWSSGLFVSNSGFRFGVKKL
jgi:hypothetical protein